MKKITLSIIITVITGCSIFAQYISEVLEYVPAPGQFINTTPWGDSDSPASIIGGVNGTLSLGAFGGYVIFKFENPVENDSDNPYGIDFTIFGNYAGSVSEPATVYIMKDENQNGIADDTWYKLAGSDSYFSSTINDYSVTYTNPKTETANDIYWTDNYGGSGAVYTNIYHTQPYYPDESMFPDISEDEYTLTGEKIVGRMDKSTPSFIKSKKRAFGYADNNPKGQEPYTIPDNPYTAENENSGGDAFDISWAVDSEGNYIEIDEIDFVKVQNSMLEDAGWLGEVSKEILGAIDVEPNTTIDGNIDLLVIKDLADTIPASDYQLEVYTFKSGRIKEDMEIDWTTISGDVYVDENNVLKIDSEGEISVSGKISGNEETIVTIETYAFGENDIIDYVKEITFRVYPSPVKDFISVETETLFNISIYNTSGQLVFEISDQNPGEKINIESLASGIYQCKISCKDEMSTVRIVKI